MEIRWILLTALIATPAHATQHALVLDLQRSSVGGVRTVRAATGVLVAAGRRGDAALSLARIDDSVDGAGCAFGAGGALRIGGGTLVRGSVGRIERAQALDSWSARLGPEIHRGRATVALSGIGGRRSDGAWTKGVALELEQALGVRVAARAAGSFARTDGEPDALAVAAGARWNALGPLHLTGELGLARDPAGTLAAPGGLLPSRQPTDSNPMRATGRLGVRIVLP